MVNRFKLLLGQVVNLPYRYNTLFSFLMIFVESYQATLMSTIDQFDDLMQYTPFKEPKSEIISQVGETLRFYIRSKEVINPKFFQVTPTVRNNLTFRTYVEAQYEELGERQAFYEVKAFRMLGNAYTNLMEGDDYELASLLTSEVVEIGRLALELNQGQLVREIIIRFNTFFRFAIKHAIRKNDPRNLHNLSFYYGNLLIAFVDYSETELVQQGYFYFRLYRSEVYKNTSTNPALHFIGDALTAELKRVSIFVSEKGWDEADQEALLSEILLLDNPGSAVARELEPSTQRGVRMLQIGLALHYLKHDQQRLAEIVIDDVLDDLELYGETAFSTMVDDILNELRYSQPAFWEDSDRGNTNIYYSPDTDYIDPFKTLLDQHLQVRSKR